jgi:hypothetical protein
VDHAHEKREDGKIVQRDLIRRGIIVKVNGEGTDSISNVYVKFKVDDDPENVKPCELDVAFPATSRKAKEAYRRVMGMPKNLGVEFKARKSDARRRIEDGMALTKVSNHNEVVKPEYNEEEEPIVTGLESLKDAGI